jgi:hypothetical protein
MQTHHLFRDYHRPTTHKERKSPEQPSLGWVEQIIAPINCGA